MKNSKQMLKAIAFSEEKHKGQLYGDSPYMEHLMETVSLARRLGYGEDIQIACVLHDVLEDTNATKEELVDNFGQEIYDIVFAVTDTEAEYRWLRKLLTYPKIKNNWKATVVKCLDRCCNVQRCLDENDANKYKMYYKEHYEFFIHVQNNNHPLQVLPAWIELGKYYLLRDNEDFKLFISSLVQTRTTVF